MAHPVTRPHGASWTLSDKPNISVIVGIGVRCRKQPVEVTIHWVAGRPCRVLVRRVRRT